MYSNCKINVNGKIINDNRLNNVNIGEKVTLKNKLLDEKKMEINYELKTMKLVLTVISV